MATDRPKRTSLGEYLQNNGKPIKYLNGLPLLLPDSLLLPLLLRLTLKLCLRLIGLGIVAPGLLHIIHLGLKQFLEVADLPRSHLSIDEDAVDGLAGDEVTEGLGFAPREEQLLGDTAGFYQAPVGEGRS